jgi:hypothetical protein
MERRRMGSPLFREKDGWEKLVKTTSAELLSDEGFQ